MDFSPHYQKSRSYARCSNNHRTDRGRRERRNIIVEHVILEGIIRTFDDDIYKSLKEDIIEMLNGLEMSHGVKTNFKEIVYYPVVYNNRRLVERLSSILTKDILVDTAPL